VKTEDECVIDDSDLWEKRDGVWIPSRKRDRSLAAELLGHKVPEPPKERHSNELLAELTVRRCLDAIAKDKR
jgi:hypothetical protein